MSSANASEDSTALDVEPPQRGETRRVGWSEQRYHGFILLMACGILAASAVLRVESPVRVVVPGIGMPLPTVCMFRNLTSVDCPGCGLTRSFVCLAHGQWRLAWNYHPLGWIFFGVVVAQIPIRVIQLRRLRRGQSPLVLRGVVPFTWALMLLLLAQWIVRGF